MAKDVEGALGDKYVGQVAPRIDRINRINRTRYICPDQRFGTGVTETKMDLPGDRVRIHRQGKGIDYVYEKHIESIAKVPSSQSPHRTVP